MDDEYSEIETKLITLCQAFESIFPHAGFHYGHIVIQDYNLDLSNIEWALEHLDDFHADRIAEIGEATAKQWRDATYHLLMLIKQILDNAE